MKRPSPKALRRFPHGSQRSTVMGVNGMVATSQPLATQAGVSVLTAGGNAVDAAIATAATLTVVEPCSNGLGSDGFALIHDGTSLRGFNGSGRWPMASDAEPFRAQGMHTLPQWGWPAVTVPGAIDMWAQMHERFGKLPLPRVLEPAISFAENGFPVSPVVAMQWLAAGKQYLANPDPAVADWGTVFAPDGVVPDAGQLWRSAGHTNCLKTLASSGLRDFYEGEIAEAITSYSSATGGALTAQDLASHRGEWVDPISVSYGGHEIWEIPPNGQGIAALIALGIVANTEAPSHPQLSVESWHQQIEAMKLAFSDSDAYVGDPQHGQLRTQGLLEPSYHAERAALIRDIAGNPDRGEPATGGTVYLCTADSSGLMVSFIQSNYHGFGSGVVVPSHGVSLQNRGAGFVLTPGHPNEAHPGKRPRHTIIPSFITRDGEPVGPFGVMGGEMQPQGHLQVATGLIDHGLSPQAALDAPRWQVDRDWTVRVEAETPPGLIEGLRERGHVVRIEPHRLSMGRGQIIMRLDNGVLAGGSEPRADGCAIAL